MQWGEALKHLIFIDLFCRWFYLNTHYIKFKIIAPPFINQLKMLKTHLFIVFLLFVGHLAAQDYALTEDQLKDTALIT